jgi:exosortase
VARPRPYRLPRTLLGAWLALGAALAAVYLPHVAYMVQNWWTDPNYSHGFLIPAVAGWLIWRRRQELAGLPARPSAWGVAVIAGGLLLLVLGQAGHELFLRRLSLVPVLWGVVLAYWGWPVARAVGFPFAYLILMIPLPYVVYDSVAFPLRLVAAGLAGGLLELSGTPVLVEGNIIHLPSTVLNVVDACSGVRSLVSLLAVALLFARLLLHSWWRRALLVLAVPPVAVATNALRVVAAGLLAEHWGEQTLQGATHDLTGWLVFMAAFGLLAGLARLLRLGAESGAA